MRDRGQLVVEPACKREQIVALILQRDAYRADATRIDMLAPAKLCDDEIENLVANVQAGTGQRQDVVGEPGGERPDVAGQGMRPLFGLPGERDPVGKVRILTCFPALGLQFFTSRPGALGDAGQGVGQHFALMLDVEDVAVTGRSSALVENLNSRLRNYFTLRRQLGGSYLDLLQFFLNHRRFLRSRVPERVGKSPTQLMTGQDHPHWLTLLGLGPLQPLRA